MTKKKTNQISEYERIEKLYGSHIKELKSRFGWERAASSNIGWAITDNGIASKVYGNPCMILNSMYWGKNIVHSVIPYNDVLPMKKAAMKKKKK